MLGVCLFDPMKSKLDFCGFQFMSISFVVYCMLMYIYDIDKTSLADICILN